MAAPLPTQRVAVSPIPVAVAPPPSPPARRRSRSGMVAQLLVIAVVAGVLVAGGLLALELFAPRGAAPVDLVHRSFPDFGFSVSRPPNWTEAVRRLGANPAVVFTADATHGFQVVAVPTTLAQARAAVAQEIGRPPPNKDPIQVNDDAVVDSRPAFRYALIQDGRYREEWWVARPGGAFRIEFWAPEYNQRDAAELAQNIVDTFGLG
jgi:hypothetical protein